MRAVKEEERNKRLTFPLFLGILTCSDYAWKMVRWVFSILEADVAGLINWTITDNKFVAVVWRFHVCRAEPGGAKLS